MQKERSVMSLLKSSRPLTAALFFAIGGATTYGVTKFLEKKTAHQDPAVEEIAQRPPIDPPNTFKHESAKAAEAHDQALEEDHVQQYFEEAMNMGGGVKEDGQFLSYEIDLDGQTPKEVKVEVQGGQVFISGSAETKEESDGSRSVFTSSFQQSFPIPPNVEGEKYKVEKEDGKIIVKFPKKKA